jgi:hypothetical protein
MDLAERLHMTLSQLFANADSRELGLWMARAAIEAEEQKKRDLMARAEAARRKR